MDMSETASTLSPEASQQIDRVIEEYKDESDPLLEVLSGVQRIYGHLSGEMLIAISTRLAVPASQVYGVATFYSLLSTRPKGRNIIRVCESAPCHVSGSDSVLQAVTDELDISQGETTPDGLFTLESASCLGICSVGPAMMVNDRVYGNLTREKVRMILRRYASEKEESAS